MLASVLWRLVGDGRRRAADSIGDRGFGNSELNAVTQCGYLPSHSCEGFQLPLQPVGGCRASGNKSGATSAAILVERFIDSAGTIWRDSGYVESRPSWLLTREHLGDAASGPGTGSAQLGALITSTLHADPGTRRGVNLTTALNTGACARARQTTGSRPSHQDATRGHLFIVSPDLCGSGRKCRRRWAPRLREQLALSRS